VPRFRRVLLHAALALVCLAMLYPLLWMLRGSLVAEDEIFSSPSVLPTGADVGNYVEGWGANPPGFGRFLLNSVVVSAGAVVGNLVACTLAAYAFARLEFPLRRLWFAVMLGTVMLPAHATLIPQYSIFTALGWVDTYLPLVVPKFLATDAYFVFLIVQFLRSIPRELDEAAEIDGAGLLDVLWRIVVPLSKPAIATVAVFAFINHWNDFLRPLIFLQLPERLTLAVGLRWFTGRESTEFHLLMAASFMALLPVIIVFFVAQKQFVRGIALTGLKG
jgi:multiple sugar transport system permease protein